MTLLLQCILLTSFFFTIILSDPLQDASARCSGDLTNYETTTKNNINKDVSASNADPNKKNKCKGDLEKTFKGIEKPYVDHISQCANRALAAGGNVKMFNDCCNGVVKDFRTSADQIRNGVKACLNRKP